MHLSFIVTTYDLRPSEIERCLNSLLCQGLSTDDFEVLVVDDASAESPQALVEGYADRMDVRFLTQPHARQGAARNRALHLAKGDYIQIVDGDDYLFAGCMCHIISTIEAHDLDMLIYSHRQVADATGIRCCPHVGSRTDFYRGTDYLRAHTLFGSSCTMCFRRGLLALDSDHPLLFPEGISIEDEDFVTRLVWRTPRLGVTNLVGYAYVARDGSTTRSRNAAEVAQRYADTFTVLDRLITFRDEVAATSDTCPADTAGLDRKLHFLAVDILRHALREHDWQERFQSCRRELQARSLNGQPLFPLPSASWSLPYRLFRRLSDYSWGTRFLRSYELRQERTKVRTIRR